MLRSLIVPSERVTGRQEEDCFHQNETGIDPVDVAEGAKVDSMADVGDRCGDTHIAVVLKMFIVDFDQKVVGVHLSRQR